MEALIYIPGEIAVAVMFAGLWIIDRTFGEKHRRGRMNEIEPAPSSSSQRNRLQEFLRKI
jgi:hypothetical protein